jgi:hypothetical protein
MQAVNMLKLTTNAEPIAADPIIIDSPSVQPAVEKPKSPAIEKSGKAVGDLPECSSSSEDHNEEDDVVFRVRSKNRSPIVIRERDYSPPSRRRRIFDTPRLASTASLDSFIDEPDLCAETVNNQLIYISNNAFHAKDLEKISWIFKSGPADTWLQEPSKTKTRKENGRSYGMYEDRYEERYDEYRTTPIARLGIALKIFRTDEKKYGTVKVKFVSVVKGKNSAAWMKFIISHSRQSAGVDLFHEILNENEIAFVGAVLENVSIPVKKADRATIKFVRAGSLEEAQKAAEGVIGIIC